MGRNNWCARQEHLPRSQLSLDTGAAFSKNFDEMTTVLADGSLFQKSEFTVTNEGVYICHAEAGPDDQPKERGISIGSGKCNTLAPKRTWRIIEWANEQIRFLDLTL